MLFCHEIISKLALYCKILFAFVLFSFFKFHYISIDKSSKGMLDSALNLATAPAIIECTTLILSYLDVCRFGKTTSRPIKIS
jgi:hypothetical protein